MNFEQMKIDELKQYLDGKADYSEAKVKADFVKLAEQVSTQDTEESEVIQTETNHTISLADKVKTATKIERTETKKVDDVSYLKDRDYSLLSVGERAMIREQSPEYQDDDLGIEVTVTDRLPTKWRIVKLADKSYSKLIKGATYLLSQKDFDVLKEEQVKVKTEATKNKCCGQARYETIDLLVIADD